MSDRKYNLYKRIMKHDPKAIDEIESLEEAKEIIQMMCGNVYLNGRLYQMQRDFAETLKERDCTDIEVKTKGYNDDVMNAVRQVLGLDKNDTSKDEEIMEMEKHEVFQMYCQWNGLLENWDNYLLEAIQSIYKVDLK